MGGKTKLCSGSTSRIPLLMRLSSQVTLFARNFHSPISHLTLSILETSLSMLLLETSPISLLDAKLPTSELLRTRSSTSQKDLVMQNSLLWRD